MLNALFQFLELLLNAQRQRSAVGTTLQVLNYNFRPLELVHEVVARVFVFSESLPSSLHAQNLIACGFDDSRYSGGDDHRNPGSQRRHYTTYGGVHTHIGDQSTMCADLGS